MAGKSENDFINMSNSESEISFSIGETLCDSLFLSVSTTEG